MIRAAVDMAAKARRMSPLLAATCTWHTQSHYPLCATEALCCSPIARRLSAVNFSLVAKSVALSKLQV